MLLDDHPPSLRHLYSSPSNGESMGVRTALTMIRRCELSIVRLLAHLRRFFPRVSTIYTLNVHIRLNVIVLTLQKYSESKNLNHEHCGRNSNRQRISPWVTRPFSSPTFNVYRPSVRHVPTLSTYKQLDTRLF